MPSAYIGQGYLAAPLWLGTRKSDLVTRGSHSCHSSDTHVHTELSAVKTTSMHEGAAVERGSLQGTDVAKVAEQEILCSFHS